MMSGMNITICYVVNIFVLKEIGLLNHITLREYRDLTNTENKAQLKRFMQLYTYYIIKRFADTNWIKIVHHH